jgi:hypothetical protein
MGGVGWGGVRSKYPLKYSVLLIPPLRLHTKFHMHVEQRVKLFISM